MVISNLLSFPTFLTCASRPSIPPSAQNMFLATLLSSLDGIIKHGARKSANSGGSRALSTANSMPTTVECSRPSPTPASSLLQDSTSPFDYMTLGINQVTRKLEFQARSLRKIITLTTGSRVNQPSSNLPPISVVFVCHADVNPPILLDHIPHLVAGCNSTRPGSDPQGVWKPLKLIVLPEGSEPVLAQALGLRRAAVIGIHVSVPKVKILTSDASIRVMPHFYLDFLKCSNLYRPSVRLGLYLHSSPLLGDP